jgi:hypothetical protein
MPGNVCQDVLISTASLAGVAATTWLTDSATEPVSGGEMRQASSAPVATSQSARSCPSGAALMWPETRSRTQSCGGGDCAGQATR